MKPINDLAFNKICLDFSCSCMNFCSEATYITMEEIAHDCNPIHWDEEQVENNFIENIVCKIYEMVMTKEGFQEYIAEYLYQSIQGRWGSGNTEKEQLSYFTSFESGNPKRNDWEDFEENFDSFLEDIDYDFLTKNLKRCWDRACITDKPFPLEELIKMLASDRIGTSEII